MLPAPLWVRCVVAALPSRLRTRLKAGLLPVRVVSRRKPQAAARLLLAPRRRILVHMPLPWTVLTKIAARNGYWLEVDPERPHDIGLNRKSGVPMSSPAGVSVLNGQLASNHKSNVAAVFEAVFGYSLAVDPTAHAGPMVEKSEINALHDGRVVDGPLHPEEVQPGQSYQRFIDTRDEDGQVVDLRTPLYGGSVPFVYIKRRPVKDLFWTRTAATEICETADVYSPEELALLARFAAEIGLDYGEVDVLRDRRDGRIYVVDVNQGPAGPPQKLSPSEAEAAVTRLATAFDALVDRTLSD